MEDGGVEPYLKPVPKVEPEAAPYWQSLRDHAMKVQHCDSCGHWYFPPSTHCPACLSADVTWRPVSGRAVVWSSATMHRAYLPAYEGEIPYNLSLVELDEGPRVWTNVVEIPPDQVRIGLNVRVRYDDVTPGLTLARFIPAAGQ
ncbi:MAG: hypothetical protein EXR69_10450 [Myxococcales bacterium]|nr:hypothetical protein [Myxococcales bacterium]